MIRRLNRQTQPDPLPHRPQERLAPYCRQALRLQPLLEFLLPGYVAEGKAYLTIAVGCTGGRHRSVVVAEDLSAHLERAGWPVSVELRDLERE